jgi:metal-dependent amidase/aminoacylase/carboxypeptidase family protein
MTKEELKVRVCAEIDRQADRIMGIRKHILAHPEIGFCETKTASYVADQFADMGLRYRSGLASSASDTLFRSRISCTSNIQRSSLFGGSVARRGASYSDRIIVPRGV